MENEYEHISTKDIIIEMANLEKEINMGMIRYEHLRQEIIKRYPQLLEDNAFNKGYEIKRK